MAINITKQNGHIAYETVEYVLDTVEDLADLPTNVAVGSTAFIIANSTVYMLNSSGEWKEI